MINPDCPQCRERIQKDACSCEDRYNSLQSKYQKLVIVFAIVSGIVGKTIVEEAMSLFETAAPIVDTISSNEKPTSEIVFNNSKPYHNTDTVLFANVPPLLSNLTHTNEVPDLFAKDFDRQIFIPGVTPLAPMVLFFSEQEKT